MPGGSARHAERAPVAMHSLAPRTCRLGRSARRVFTALLVAATASSLGACDDPAAQAPTSAPAPSSAPAASAPSVEAEATAAPAQSAAPTAEPTAAAEASADPTPTASAATTGEAKPLVEGTAPKAPASSASGAQTGILKAGQADRFLKKGAASKVRLIDAGAEPRAALRYAMAPNQTVGLELGLTMSLELEAAGKKVPAQTIPKIVTRLDLTTGAKPAEGAAFPIDATVRGVSVAADDEKLSQALAEKLLPHLKGIEGMSLQYLVSSDGRVKQAGSKVPEGASGQARETLAQMTQSLESMIAPFPEEAVGVGARWEVVTRFESSGTELVQWSTFRLLERSDTTVKLALDIAQAAASAEVRPPNLPPGVGAKLDSFSSLGKGQTTIELDSAAPKTAKMRVESSMGIGITQGTNSQRTSMKSTMDVDVARRPAGAAAKPQAPSAP